jgi:hypothetical protein
MDFLTLSLDFLEGILIFSLIKKKLNKSLSTPANPTFKNSKPNKKLSKNRSKRKNNKLKKRKSKNNKNKKSRLN